VVIKFKVFITHTKKLRTVTKKKKKKLTRWFHNFRTHGLNL